MAKIFTEMTVKKHHRPNDRNGILKKVDTQQFSCDFQSCVVKNQCLEVCHFVAGSVSVM